MKLVYDRDGARFYNGDARDMAGIENGSVHMVITSPPYYNAREQYSSWLSYAEYLKDMLIVWRECYRVLCDGGRIAVNVLQGYDRPANGGYKNIGDDTYRALIESGFECRGHIIWNKRGISPQGNGTAWGSWCSASSPALRDCHEIIIVCHKGSISRPDREGKESTIKAEDFMPWTQSVWDIAPCQAKWHPAPFPVQIPRRLIQLYTFKGDVVLDPFSGSGTTVWEAANSGRAGIGVEQRMDYLQLCCGTMLMIQQD